MAITKTGIQVDTDPTFSNPLEFEAQGEVRSIDATGLEPSTTYYTRGYVVELGNRTYSRNSRTFETLTPNYFTIQNRKSTSTTVTLEGSDNTNIALQYSLDNGSTWTSWNSSMGVFSVTLGDHQAVKLRGENTTMQHNRFAATDDCNLSGDINTLINKVGGDVQLPNNCYAALFSGILPAWAKFYNDGIVLPSTVIGNAAYQGMFWGQKFTTAPKINAITIGAQAFEMMFCYCTELTTLPNGFFNENLTLSESCCHQMFTQCTSLTTVPVNLLPFTTLADSCYNQMFCDCTSLTNVPNLPATTLSYDCYDWMFSGCTSLSNVPNDLLPATTLTAACYEGMFAGTALTSMPNLPATTIGQLSYAGMFAGTPLTSVDLSHITTVGVRSFEVMFQGCTSLNSVHAPNVSTWDTTVFKNWLNNVAGSGTLYKLDSSLSIPTDSPDGVPVGWTQRYPIGTPLMFTNEYNGANTISLTRDGLQTTNISLDYSTDNGSTWTHWDSTDGNLSVPLSAGGSVLLKGDNQRFSDASLDARWHFDSDYEFSVSGNLMSLLDSSRMRTDVPSYAFSHLFMATKINGVQSGLLPATELSMYCYTYMFAGCQNLTTLPLDLLPATDLYGSGGDSEATNCYAWMFTGCRNLTNCPNLPARDLSMYCYKDMFMGCTSLVHPMAELPADSISNFAYESMFSGCTSLVCSPDIKATTYSGNAMNNMFTNCSSLCAIIVHIQNWDTRCTGDWVDGVAATGDFYNLGGATIPTGTSGIPTNWTEYDTLPFWVENIGDTAGNVSANPRNTGLDWSTKYAQYSFDLATWEDWLYVNGQISSYFSVPANSKVYIRTTVPIASSTISNCLQVRFGFDAKLGGDIRSLVDYTDRSLSFINDGLTYLFSTTDGASQIERAAIKDITEIDFSHLTRIALMDTFRGNTGFTTAPPSIKHITDSASRFDRAFLDCSSLNTVTAPNITSWNTYSFTGWMTRVAATGTMYAPTGLTIPSGTSGIPTDWTRVDY